MASAILERKESPLKSKRPSEITVISDNDFRQLKRSLSKRLAKLTPGTATTPSVAIWGRNQSKVLLSPMPSQVLDSGISKKILLTPIGPANNLFSIPASPTLTFASSTQLNRPAGPAGPQFNFDNARCILSRSEKLNPNSYPPLPPLKSLSSWKFPLAIEKALPHMSDEFSPLSSLPPDISVPGDFASSRSTSPSFLANKHNPSTANSASSSCMSKNIIMLLNEVDVDPLPGQKPTPPVSLPPLSPSNCSLSSPKSETSRSLAIASPTVVTINPILLRSNQTDQDGNLIIHSDLDFNQGSFKFLVDFSLPEPYLIESDGEDNRQRIFDDKYDSDCTSVPSFISSPGPGQSLPTALANTRRIQEDSKDVVRLPGLQSLLDVALPRENMSQTCVPLPKPFSTDATTPTSSTVPSQLRSPQSLGSADGPITRVWNRIQSTASINNLSLYSSPSSSIDSVLPSICQLETRAISPISPISPVSFPARLKRKRVDLSELSVSENDNLYSSQAESSSPEYYPESNSRINRPKRHHRRNKAQTSLTAVSQSSDENNENLELVSKLRKIPTVWATCLRTKKGYYTCSHCGDRFSTLSTFAAHIDHYKIKRQHTCSDPTCPWMYIGFSKRSELTRHIKCQHTSRPNVCPYCDKEFGRKDSMKRHIELVHPMGLRRKK